MRHRKWLLPFIVLCIAAFILHISLERLSATKESKKKRNSIPSLRVFFSDSTLLNLDSLSTQRLVLIHFNSECDHCIYQAEEVLLNVDEFKDTDIVFMSSESLSEVSKFATMNGLNLHSNIHVVKVDANEVEVDFGILTIPHIFIYNREKVLVKEFKGETKAAAIVKSLSDETTYP